MFRAIMSFSRPLTALQAFGWYVIFLLIGFGLVFATEAIVRRATQSDSQTILWALVAGVAIVIPYVIVLGVLLLRGRPKNVTNIVLVVVGAVLSPLAGLLGGLIPLAVLTTRPARSQAGVSAVFE
jgi:hypothetical protein